MTAAVARQTDIGDAGFTLLELIVAVMLMALAAYFIAPSGDRSLRRLEFQAAATDVATAMRLARAEAMRSNRELSVAVDLNRRQIVAPDRKRPRALPKALSIRYEAPAGEQSAPGVANFRFHPDGRSSGGKVVLSSAARSATVSVDWLTGQTSVDWSR